MARINAVCPQCHHVQRIYRDNANNTIAPHLLRSPDDGQWTYCPGSGVRAVRFTHEEPVQEVVEIGSITEVGMIHLLAAAIIEHGWTILAGLAPLTPLDAAATLVRDMVLGSLADGPER